ncbi:hypothetical protein LTR28_009457 [Elasticomyces elasticus]|nr:hypothetical protein LTR28_009457 [Elasticomyces elasticus]
MSFTDPELVYLEPGFDPSSLTIPRLRSILVSHNIQYPSSAKKSQLIELFNGNVLPQARKLLNAQAKTKPSTRGIVDVSSSQGSMVDDEDEEDVIPLLPPPPPPGLVRRASRRTTRARTDDATRTASTPVVIQRSSSKHARTSDAELDRMTDAKRLARPRTRRSVTPGINPDEAITYEDESAFSNENPFQSGSSPPAPARSRSKSKDRRRMTLGPNTDKDWRKSRDSRRKTEGFKGERKDDGVVVPSSKTFEMPVVRAKQQLVPVAQPGPVDLGEEFTPEEQLELVRGRAQNGEMDILPSRRRREQQTSSIARVAPLAIIAAMLGGLAAVWRQEKLEVGYCGIGRPATHLAGVEIPDWATFLQPQCEPCPQHAYCYPELKAFCEPDFILKPHPLSLNGLVPFAPTCEPDGEKARRVKAVADRTVEELRKRNAKFECGELVDEQGKHLPAEVEEEELKQAMSAKRSKRMSQEEFDDLWAPAMGEVHGRDEVVIDSDGTRRFLRSTSFAHVGLVCAVRRSIRVALARNLWKLVALLLIIGTGLSTQKRIADSRSTESQAKQLASAALSKLREHASLNAVDPGTYPESCISMAQLRDDVLRDEFSASRRQKLWEKVKVKVEGNSNVRPMVREGRHGDVSRVWEWIGAVGLIEGMTPEGVRRRKSGIAGGRMIEAKVEDRDDGGPGREVERWNEGRPIY